MYLYFGTSNSKNLRYAICSNNHPSETNWEKEWYIKPYLDIYIMMVSSLHCVSKKGTYVAIISTTCETNDPEKELSAAFNLIGAVKEKFIRVT